MSPTCRTVLALLAAGTVLGASRTASAHTVGLSTGDYVAEGATVTARWTFARGELQPLIQGADATDALGALVVRQGTLVRGDGAACSGVLDDVSAAEPDGVTLRAHYTCPSPIATLAIELRLLDTLPGEHRHVASARIAGTSRDEVLERGHETLTVGAGSSTAPPSRRGFLAFFAMGVEHILTGYDHLVFLLGLLLVGGRLRALVGVVTAFTLAHSLTLALAALGVWSPPARLVEAAIGLSIVYVGVENFFVTSAERRWRITFPFGLVHGFGFASALRQAALARAEVPLALVSFNLGVEVGQLAVMAVVLPAIVVLRRRGWLDRRATLVASAGVALAGAAWVVARL